MQCPGHLGSHSCATVELSCQDPRQGQSVSEGKQCRSISKAPGRPQGIWAPLKPETNLRPFSQNCAETTCVQGSRGRMLKVFPKKLMEPGTKSKAKLLEVKYSPPSFSVPLR